MISLDVTSLFGYAAIIASTFVALPQTWRMHVNKHARDVSLFTMVLLMLAQILWMIYGRLIGNDVVAFASVPAMFIIAIEMVMYYKYKNNR